MADPIEYIFDPSILEDLDLSEYDITFEDGASVTCPEEDFMLRPLSTADYEKGFTDVLSQLTRVGEVTKTNYLDRFNQMKVAYGYYPIVIEHTKGNNGNGKIVGTGMLEIEQKFIHSCALRGRVEEVVVDKEYRGKKFGKLVLAVVTALSKKLKCYKTTLECKVENVDFYNKFQYKEDPEKFMQRRFRD